MNMSDWFLAQLETEAELSRRALARVPEGRDDWKPHEKSMPLGYLAALVASMPAWVLMTLQQDEFDLISPDAAKFKPQRLRTAAELLAAHDANVALAREALANATDDDLLKPWKFKVGERVVSEQARYVMLRDGVLSHLAHHRGQLTVYLRLNEIPVPALYGPSADEGS